MLFVAESNKGALASHSSTLIVGLAGVGAGTCAWFRRGGARVEVILQDSEDASSVGWRQMPRMDLLVISLLPPPPWRVSCKFCLYFHRLTKRLNAKTRSALGISLG